MGARINDPRPIGETNVFWHARLINGTRNATNVVRPVHPSGNVEWDATLLVDNVLPSDPSLVDPLFRHNLASRVGNGQGGDNGCVSFERMRMVLRHPHYLGIPRYIYAGVTGLRIDDKLFTAYGDEYDMT